MHIQKWIALNRKKLYRFAFAPNRDPPSTRTDSPLLSHHRLTHDKLQFVHDRAENWPKELKRIFSFLLPPAVLYTVGEREDTDKVTPKENRQRHAGTEDRFVHQSGF